MGTGGYFGFYYNGEYYVWFSGYDSYYPGLGCELLRQILEALLNGTLEDWKKQLHNIKIYKKHIKKYYKHIDKLSYDMYGAKYDIFGYKKPQKIYEDEMGLKIIEEMSLELIEDGKKLFTSDNWKKCNHRKKYVDYDLCSSSFKTALTNKFIDVDITDTLYQYESDSWNCQYSYILNFDNNTFDACGKSAEICYKTLNKLINSKIYNF